MEIILGKIENSCNKVRVKIIKFPGESMTVGADGKFASALLAYS
jgi:hypothetical protein